MISNELYVTHWGFTRGVSNFGGSSILNSHNEACCVVSPQIGLNTSSCCICWTNVIIALKSETHPRSQSSHSTLSRMYTATKYSARILCLCQTFYSSRTPRRIYVKTPMTMLWTPVQWLFYKSNEILMVRGLWLSQQKLNFVTVGVAICGRGEVGYTYNLQLFTWAKG